ncbi:MAG: hypothetical protein QM599_13030 [Pseudoxanthomonas sp.]
MKLSSSLAVLLLLHAMDASAACNLDSGYTTFGLASGATPAEAPPDALDAPKLKAVGITRGVGGVPGSCDGTGILVLDLKLPGGDYKLDEIGIEFEVLSANSPVAVFPTTPIAITTGKRRSEILVMWPDEAPSVQKPLLMEVQARAVTHGYLRGPATRFIVDSRELGK